MSDGRARGRPRLPPIEITHPKAWLTQYAPFFEAGLAVMGVANGRGSGLARCFFPGEPVIPAGARKAAFAAVASGVVCLDSMPGGYSPARNSPFFLCFFLFFFCFFSHFFIFYCFYFILFIFFLFFILSGKARKHA